MTATTTTKKHLPFRIIIASVMILPAAMFIGLLLIATPDLGTWLSDQAEGFARVDAFDGVTEVSPPFALLLGITSFFAAFLVVSRKSPYLLPLATGPLLTSLVYLAEYGVTDPSWWSLLALLGIGMLVGTPVTAVWVMVNWSRDTVNGNGRALVHKPKIGVRAW